MAESMLLWLATYLVHSTVLLALAALADRAGLLRDTALAETAWRAALFGALVTASVAPLGSALDALRSAAPAAARHAAVATTEAAWSAKVPGTIRTQPRAPSEPLPTVTSSPGVAPAGIAVPDRPRLELPSTVRTLAAPLLGAWGALSAILVALLAAQLLRLRRAAREAPAAERPLVAVVERLARRAGIVAPRVHVTNRWASPLVTPDRRLCVPTWALEDLSDEQREAMLAHEIAHLKRRDPAWRLVAEAVTRVFAIQPLNRIAARRLDELAELECDAWAATATGRGRDLAECLVACAEHVHARRAPALALAMARPSSPLIERVSTLLEDLPMRNPLRRAIARTLAVGVAVAVLAALPVVAIEAVRAAAGEDGRHSVSIVDSGFGKSMKVDIDGREGRLRAAIDGEIQFNAAESDVATLDDEAYIETTRDGVKRRIEFEAAGGGVERRYYVDGDERPLDGEGRAWLAQAIPMLMRETGWEAEKRVARIRAAGGVPAVFAEIERIGSDYARRKYLVALAEGGPLAPAELDRSIGFVGEIASDYERRVTYVAIAEEQDLGAPQQAALLKGAAGMESDFEQRTVLQAVTPELVGDPAVVAAWAAAIGELGSDFEARTAISALEDRGADARPFVAAALAATRELGSDFERRTTLGALAPHLEAAPELRRAYAESAASMGSDYERRVALVTLIETVVPDVELALAVLDAADGMGSDYETRTVLVELAAKMPADAQLIRRYRQVARTLGDYERGQAEKALDRFEV